jgi:hypothetical protein
VTWRARGRAREIGNVAAVWGPLFGLPAEGLGQGFGKFRSVGFMGL